MNACVQVAALDLISKLFAAYSALAKAAGELATKHIYLDPRDPAEDLAARSYCALCMRYGLNCRAIDHAESCLVGRVVLCLDEIRAQLQSNALSGNSNERTSANSSTAVAEQEGAAAEGPVRVPDLENRDQEEPVVETRRVVYQERRTFNPYANPCAESSAGLVCELENGHAGAHCCDGAVWADDGCVWDGGLVWADGSRRSA